MMWVMEWWDMARLGIGLYLHRQSIASNASFSITALKSVLFYGVSNITLKRWVKPSQAVGSWMCRTWWMHDGIGQGLCHVESACHTVCGQDYTNFITFPEECPGAIGRMTTSKNTLETWDRIDNFYNDFQLVEFLHLWYIVLCCLMLWNKRER